MIEASSAQTDPTLQRQLLMGDEAVALGALHAGVALGTGYPGTPSTEILESFSALGGRAQWAPNEKVAAEVALGVAFAGGHALVTMKHVGLNVAADPLFTAAYTGVTGGFVLVSADDPGMASSQNEQDNRRYAVAAGVPMLEPSDSQEAYDFTSPAFELSERWRIPVLLRLTTRICHSKTRGHARAAGRTRAQASLRARHPGPRHDPRLRPPAHRRLRAKTGRDRGLERDRRASTASSTATDALGIITSGDRVHARPRGGARGEHPQARHDLSAAPERHPRLRRVAWNAAWSSRRATRTWSTPSAPPGSRSKANPRCSASAS